MDLMRALHRTVAAITLALPLVVAGSAMANAGTPASHHKEHHKVKIDVDQAISQSATQSNSNGPTNVSGNHNSVTTEQENEALQSATENAFSE
jgi:hypothetical protein